MARAIEVSGLTKRYDGVTAVRDLDLVIESGEIFVLIGPNGAGKTTVVRSITGAVRPSAGSVSVLGEPPGTVVDGRLGLLPQAFNPPGRLTAREIVGYYAGLYNEARDVDAVLEDVGMANDADRWYERLSGGQQRRVCVASALVNDPELLLLDEPTTGIDPRGRRQLWELFEGLRREGRTILLTTHDMTEAASLGDRVGLLDDGRLIETGSPSELVERHGGTGSIVVEPAVGSVETLLEYPVTERDGRIHIEDVDPPDVATIIRTLDDADVEYRRIAWEPPSLEDVYFALTGEATT